MAITPSATETQAFTALRSFILGIVDCEVVRLPNNRVPMPIGAFVALSPTSNIPLSTIVTTYDATHSFNKRSSQLSIQIDCYGAGSGDMATSISSLLRSVYGVDQLTASGYDIAPLYAGDAHQMPLVDGEDQYEERWTFDAVLQINPVMTVTQQTANTLHVGVINVDRVYPTI